MKRADSCEVVITTSRLPSKKTLELINDLVNSLPGVEKVVRGKKPFTSLLEEAVIRGARYIAFIWDRRGMPSALLFYDVVNKMWKPYMLKISGIKTRRELPVFTARRPPAKSAVVVDLAGGELGDIFAEIFRYPLVYDLDAVRGLFDTVILVRPGDRYVVEVLGRDLGPRATVIKIAKVIYRHV
ncbi:MULTISPECIES: ribosomal biogenesis protein [Pyrobaculum]|uniref:Probable Brix domain-containing ribosomal biogenesis protein n=2 Tax=Pyrobaculum arsenaticum TaxID=121277 RepID=A4WM70_PYRAR|nr:ribosomal biogenesis protein [Pyrobaculum arsenaticum]ABP51487.1 ribosomal biogenesis protein, containing Brix domain [Pyrobaculum arsenaticum DSM 13514]MCY0890964.1 ribosomal biosynthesis protein [Pyrobaculum arsenaticum]NYR16544.1 ribosomal biosynthesis protein [Pyrobaculum arsenaticum]